MMMSGQYTHMVTQKRVVTISINTSEVCQQLISSPRGSNEFVRRIKKGESQGIESDDFITAEFKNKKNMITRELSSGPISVSQSLL
jgi:hypothetical protein